jgi:hypothetical protein
VALAPWNVLNLFRYLLEFVAFRFFDELLAFPFLAFSFICSSAALLEPEFLSESLDKELEALFLIAVDTLSGASSVTTPFFFLSEHGLIIFPSPVEAFS